MTQTEESNRYAKPFDLRLTQVEGSAVQGKPKHLTSTFIGFKTVRNLSQKERVLEWNVPLVALQRKIGENSRFVLPEKGVIDDVFNFTLEDYRVATKADFPGLLTIFWVKQGASPKGESGGSDGSSNDENDKKTL
ncbi:MAG: hypothetical protein Q9195_005163 [Heterodermia aff. obscurata]